jgi:uncharacterized protein YbcV (DUF1398 family)
LNPDRVREIAGFTLSGSLPFPEIIQLLIGEGIEYYHVDYVAKQFVFYSVSGEVCHTPLQFEDLPGVSSKFDIGELRKAILDSQQNGQKYLDFLVRAMKAGVQSYFAFIAGKRVTYLGRQGDQHIEWFPGAKP